MTNGSGDPTRVMVLYDPLCGWCYGATPALRRLAERADVRLELVPTGLFSGEGARPMAGFAEHAWTNDQRIEKLTGQRFSKRYRDHVLADSGTKLDSGPATVALTAAALAGPGHELDALVAVQAARYVEGCDVTEFGVLADILRRLGFDAAAARLTGPDPELLTTVSMRTAEARSTLDALGARGVPTVVVGDIASQRVIPSDGLYGPFDDLLRHIKTA